jgi:hypothetical protein
MKSKNPITKKVTTLLLCAALSATAALILSCAPLLESSAPVPAGTGRVVLTVSAEAAGPVRTILPAEEPGFSRYKLVFSKSGETPIEIDNAAGLAGSGVSQELTAGIWTATVTAYRKFTVSEGTENEYQAAGGSADITVNAGQSTNKTVNLAPLPVEATEPGIFTYTVNFPAGATAELIFGSEAPVPLTSGTEVSVEKAPGYYNLFISVTKGSLSAGLSEKVHIYAGLESKAEFTFEDADFTETVYLAGTVILPGGLTWGDDISSGTVNVYSDSSRTIQIGPVVSLTGLSWVAGIPVTYIGSTVYLGAALTGTDGKIYTGTETATISVTETGVRNISLTDTTPPVDVSSLNGTPGDGQVTLTWTNPADADLDHVEITWTPDGISPVSVPKGTLTKTITGLTNGTAYTFTVKAVDTAGNKSGGVSSAALTPLAPTGNITVTFTGLPEDQDITLTGVNTLSWAANATLNVSVSESFDAYRWHLDGVEISGANSLTLYAGNLAVKQHTLTVFVTKNGVEYTKRVTFTVVQ